MSLPLSGNTCSIELRHVIRNLVKKQLISYDSVLDAIVCDMVTEDGYDAISGIDFDFRGETCGFCSLDGDVAELVALYPEGLKYGAADGSVYCMKITYNSEDQSYLNFRKYSSFDISDPMYDKLPFINDQTWSHTFRFYFVKYGSIVIVSKVSYKAIETVTRFIFNKDVSLHALSMLTDISFNSYVRNICHVNRGSPWYGHIVFTKFAMKQWAPMKQGMLNMNVYEFLQQGGKMSTIYGGLDPLIPVNPCPKCDLYPLVDHSDYKQFLIQEYVVSKKETYSSYILSARITRKFTRYVDRQLNDERAEMETLVKEFNYDMDAIQQGIVEAEKQLTYLLVQVGPVEDLFLNEKPDHVLILGNQEIQNEPDFVLTGHMMLRATPLLNSAGLFVCVDNPLDIREDKNVDYGDIAKYDDINLSQDISGRVTELIFYCRDEDLTFVNMRPDLSTFYDIDWLPKNSDSYYDHLEKIPNVEDERQTRRCLGYAKWIKVSSGYLLLFSVGESERPKRIRMKTCFLSSGAPVGTTYNDHSFEGHFFNHLLITFCIRYSVDSIPGLNITHALKDYASQEDYGMWRTEYSARDWVFHSKSSGYNIMSSYKGPLLRHLYTIRNEKRASIAQFILWLKQRHLGFGRLVLQKK